MHNISEKNKYTEDFYNYPDKVQFQDYVSKEIINSVVVKLSCFGARLPVINLNLEKIK